MKSFVLLSCLAYLSLGTLAVKFDPSLAVADANRFAWYESDNPAKSSREFMEKDPSATGTVAHIDAAIPLTIGSGSPDTPFTVLGTDLDQISGVFVLDQNDEWFQCPFSGRAGSTKATVVLPSSYLATPHFLLLSPVPDLRLAQSVLVYSSTVTQAVVHSTWKVTVVPEDIGAGGQLQITGNFVPGMKAVLGRAWSNGGVRAWLLISRFCSG